MALQECTLNLDGSSKEMQPHGSLDFPCAGYADRYTDREEDAIPWHWHEEMEIIYIESGKMRVKIPSKTFLLEEGDCLVINANVLHYCMAAPVCDLRSLVFSPALVTGKEDFVFAKKYMQPLLACHSFKGYCIKKESGEEVVRWFLGAFEMLVQESFGFEFSVRENLSRICLFLYEKFELQMDSETVLPDQDSIRIRRMLTHIREHFAESLSVAEIAGAADISERECLRCFQKMIQLSPIQYLLKYRIMQGAQMLSKEPAKSVSEVASLCGFDSASNFARTFKRFYDCTPREYRAAANQDSSNRPEAPHGSTSPFEETGSPIS